MLCVERELGFWGGGGICRSELGIAPVGLRLDSCLGVGLLVSKLPRRPRLVGFRPVLPCIVCPGEALTCEHRRRGEWKERRWDVATDPILVPIFCLDQSEGVHGRIRSEHPPQHYQGAKGARSIICGIIANNGFADDNKFKKKDRHEYRISRYIPPALFPFA